MVPVLLVLPAVAAHAGGGGNVTASCSLSTDTGGDLVATGMSPQNVVWLLQAVDSSGAVITAVDSGNLTVAADGTYTQVMQSPATYLAPYPAGTTLRFSLYKDSGGIHKYDTALTSCTYP